MKCCVIIPIYLSIISEKEIISIRQAISVLNNYDHYVITPDGLDISTVKKLYNEQNKHFTNTSFSVEYFKNISGYNKLMLSSFFYNYFLEFDYMLIYQTDAWIFRDDLLTWCNKGYDYIGAPWINWEWSSFYARHLTFPRRLTYRLGYRNFNLVGNGGLSLRKVRSCISNLERFKSAAAKFEQNEDYFFSLYVTSYNPFFKIPKVKEALGFAFDENPEQAFELNNQQLPMGCHAWSKYKEFWQPYIKDIHQ